MTPAREALAAARTGAALGLACAGAAVAWLGATAFAGDAPASTAVPGRAALRAVWLVLALAIAGAGPRGVSSRPRPGIVGLLVMLAVPLPLYLVLSLADVVPPATLARGNAALAGGACVVPPLAALVRRATRGDRRRVALATLEIGLAAAVWRTGAAWLRWTGA